MKRLLGWLASTLFAFGVTVVAARANANGRFPRAQRLYEDPADKNHLILTGTYGLLTTSDRGAEWQLICETSYNLTYGQEVDPVLEVAGDGSLLVGVFSSLNRSDASACSFAPVLGEGVENSVPDLTVQKSDRQRALALYSSFEAKTGARYQIYETVDNGAHWQPLGTPLPQTAVGIGITLDPAPSDPSRIYVSALPASDSGAILRSSDRGETWESFPIPNSGYGKAPYIAAVHPTDPDILYVRTDVWVPSDGGLEQAEDALLYSDDGGESWTEVFKAGAKLLGFALSPDGSSVLLGYGDPVNPDGKLDRPAMGIYKSETLGGDFSFTKIFDGSVTCITWTTNGVYVCTAELEKAYELGFARSADFTLETPEPLTPLLRRKDVAGPLACPACSTGAACPNEWQTVTCGLFSGCPKDAGPIDAGSDAACPGVDAGSDSGSDASNPMHPTDAAHPGDAALDALLDANDAAAISSAPVTQASCACRAATAERVPNAPVVLSAFAAVGLTRRRRRRNLRTGS